MSIKPEPPPTNWQPLAQAFGLALPAAPTKLPTTVNRMDDADPPEWRWRDMEAVSAEWLALNNEGFKK